MSASSKKKLRAAETAEKLTEKQLVERKEAKKLKIYTVAFAVALVAMVLLAAWIGIRGAIKNSALLTRKTVAVTVGDHKITNDELNYYFVDAANKFYRDYGSAAIYFGLDVTKPLSQQLIDAESGTTWADSFRETAIQNAKRVYAMCDAANDAGFKLDEEALAAINNDLATMDLYAAYNNVDIDSYLQAFYGSGASEKTFRAYCEATALADAFVKNYSDSLSYTEEDLRAAEAENYALYSAFTYNTYPLTVSRFLRGGTPAEDGTVIYSAEEKAAAEKMAEDTAKMLTGEDITSVDALNDAIAKLPINSDNANAASTVNTNTPYGKVSSLIQEWISDGNRQPGDKTYFANTTTSTDDEGNETTTVSSYTVVYFVSATDNNYPLANVRHILVPFEGGVKDANGNVTYSDEEKAAAKATANTILNDWRLGEHTEDSFAALANEKSSDTGSNENGGLYEDIIPGMMVPAFNDWCFAEGRKPGDTGLVMTEYGCHVMYYSADSETLYRDYLIENDLRNTAVSEWYNALVDALTVTEGNTRYLSYDLILQPAR